MIGQGDIPESVAIPLSVVKSPWVDHIGTGFLARRSGRMGLYTAAHVPVGRQPYATPGWAGWPSELRVWSRPDRAHNLRLLIPLIPMQAAFSWRLNEGSASHMADMMALHGGHHDQVLSQLSATYASIDLDSEVELRAGEEVLGFGFPRLGGDATWPYEPASVTSGRFVGATDGLNRFAMAVEDGFSGGPVFNAAGHFAGMIIGCDDDGTAGAVRPKQLQLL